MKTAVLVAWCWLGGCTLVAADTAERDRIAVLGLRSMAAQYCSSPTRTCCVSVPQGWDLDRILTQLRDLPYVRRYDPDPLLGECPGELLFVTKVEWPTANKAVVSFYFAMLLERGVDATDCEVTVSKAKGSWSAGKPACKVY